MKCLWTGKVPRAGNWVSTLGSSSSATTSVWIWENRFSLSVLGFSAGAMASVGTPDRHVTILLVYSWQQSTAGWKHKISPRVKVRSVMFPAVILQHCRGWRVPLRSHTRKHRLLACREGEFFGLSEESRRKLTMVLVQGWGKYECSTVLPWHFVLANQNLYRK